MAKLETNTVKPSVLFTNKDVEYRYISLESETSLDSKKTAVEDYMKNNDGRGKSEEEGDRLYNEAILLLKDYAAYFKNVKYSIYLNRPQYNFLTDLLLKHLEYDVNTVFFAIELTDMLKGMAGSKYKNDTDLVGFELSATELTYTYHLIAKHKVTGLTKQSYLFAEILTKIGELSKVFNYYEVANQNMQKDIQDWVVLFDESVTMENRTTPVE